MQSPSPPSSLMSTGSTASYHMAQVLYDANGAHLDLTDLYHKQ
jgi:hypothetical protein